VLRGLGEFTSQFTFGGFTLNLLRKTMSLYSSFKMNIRSANPIKSLIAMYLFLVKIFISGPYYDPRWISGFIKHIQSVSYQS